MLISHPDQETIIEDIRMFLAVFFRSSFSFGHVVLNFILCFVDYHLPPIHLFFFFFHQLLLVLPLVLTAKNCKKQGVGDGVGSYSIGPPSSGCDCVAVSEIVERGGASKEGGGEQGGVVDVVGDGRTGGGS